MKIERGFFSSSVEISMEEMDRLDKEKQLIDTQRKTNAPTCQWCNGKKSWWEDNGAGGTMICGYRCYNKNCHSHYFKKYIYQPLKNIVKVVV